MKPLSRTVLLAGAAVALVVGVTTFANQAPLSVVRDAEMLFDETDGDDDDDDDGPPTRPDRGLELVKGVFQCHANTGCCVPPVFGGLDLYFEGTIGILAESLSFQSSFEGVEGEPLAICEALSEEPIAMARSLCPSREFRTVRSEGGQEDFANITLQFVCIGPRDDVIRAMGKMSESILTAPSP